MIDAKLVIIGANIKPGEYKLKLPTIVGRSKEANLKLVHPLVSRQHCQIYEKDGQLMVRDLGSLNGTFIGEERITDAELPPGELLTIGTVTFRAEYGDMRDLMPPSAAVAAAAGVAAAETLRSADLEETGVVPVEAIGDGLGLDWLDEPGSAEPAVEGAADTAVSDQSVANTPSTGEVDIDIDLQEVSDEPPAAAGEKQQDDDDPDLDDFFKSLG